MHQKAFRETLVEQLMQVGSQRSTPGPSLLPSGPSGAHRLLVYSTSAVKGLVADCNATSAIPRQQSSAPLVISPCALYQGETVLMSGTLKLMFVH